MAIATQHERKPLLWTFANALRARLGQLWPESGAISAIPALDGLRGLAVALVVVYHAWYFNPTDHVDGTGTGYLQPLFYGSSGVQLFFVLSGFLLFLPYARWLFGLQSRPSTLLFYRRRALRVCPAYWVNLTVLVLFSALTPPLVLSALAHFVFLQNVFYMGLAYEINPVFWTMAVEVQFYLVMPLLAWAIFELAHRMSLLHAAALVLVPAALLSFITEALSRVGSMGRVPPVMNGLLDSYSLPYWLSVFATGIACSLAYVYLTRIHLLSPDQKRTLMRIAGYALGAGVVFGLIIAVVPVFHRLPSKFQLYGFVYGAILLGALLGPAWPRAVFESGVLRFVGLISYSLYLWHLVVLLVIEPHLARIASAPTRTLVGLLLDVLLGVPIAYLSFQWTERPFIQARKRAHDQQG